MTIERSDVLPATTRRYRSSWRTTVILTWAMLAMALVGFGGVLRSGHDAVALVLFALIAVLGSLFTALTAGSLRRYVSLDGEGVFVHEMFGRSGVRFVWDEVQSWLVWPADDRFRNMALRDLYPDVEIWFPTRPEHRGVFFRLRTRKRPVFIPESDVCDPSFDRFLGDLRDSIGAPEVRTDRRETAASEPAVVDAIQLPFAAAIESASRHTR